MVPYLLQFFRVLQKMHFFSAIWDKFLLYLVSIKNIDAENAPSNCAIWNEFSEQHQHQSTTFDS